MKVDYVYDQGVGIINEDQFLIQNNLFAVFDGATSLSKFVDAQGRTGGFLASSLAKEVFEKNEGSLVRLSELANQKIKEEMLANDIDISSRDNVWCTAFSAIQINGDTFEWASIADCLILIINEDNSFELLVNNYDHDRDVMVKWKKLGDISRVDKMKKLFEDLVELRKKQGISYGALNGLEYKAFLKTGQRDLQNVKHIILFTDGLIPPNEHPEKKDNFSNFVDIFLAGGLEQVKDEIRKQEESDPECIKYPRYKKHDDIAAVSITL